MRMTPARMSGPEARGEERTVGRRQPDMPLPVAGFVLNVDKPPAWTSHDAVARIRSVLRFRKVGHTGTLDPFATGVLVCCVGRATKLSNALMELPKTYEGHFGWGRQTDSGDATGELVATSPAACPPVADLRAGARELEGEILQTPPMVSAVKHRGRPLYKLARQGVTVERRPRKVRVEAFEIRDANEDRIGFRITCSRGTYIRVLAEDLAAKLGGLAHVADLRRTRVGSFTGEEAVRIDRDWTREALIERAISMSDALGHLPAWRVPPFWAAKVRRGQTPPWVVLDVAEPPRLGSVARLVTAAGDLLALAEVVPTIGPADRDWVDALGMKLTRVT